jgi:hypothetical protein
VEFQQITQARKVFQVGLTAPQRNKLTQRQQRALEFTAHLAVFS